MQEAIRFQRLKTKLIENPGSRGYVVIYGGRVSAKNSFKTASARVTTQINKLTGLDRKRIKIIDGGYREEAVTELWLGDATSPEPVPEPNVDVTEVRPPKPGSRKKR